MNKNKKNNKFLIRRFLAVIFIVFIFVFLINFLRGKKVNSYNTTFPTLTTYEDDINASIYNIFNEKIYYSKGDGIAVYNASEGQKVPVNYEVCSVNLMKDVSSLKDELNKIKSAIKYKNNSEEIEEEKINFNSDIQSAIRDRDYERANSGINSLDMDSKTTYSISDLKEYINLSNKELENKKNSLEEKISKSNITYNSEFTGIVSYKIDGLEKYYTSKNLDELTYDYINLHNTIDSVPIKTEIKENDPLFKVIDNLEYRFAITIKDADKIKNYKVGDIVNIDIDGMNSLRAKIIKINKSKNNKAVLIVYLTESFNEIYSKGRIHNGKIILEKKTGFVIPKSSLILKNNTTGVYVQEIKGLVKFVPVDIYSENDNTVFINKGNKQSIVQNEEKSYKTITINDEIVLNPRTVDQSRVLN